MSDDLNIGGMHGELGLDVRGWFDGFEDAREVFADFAKEVMKQFKDLEDKIQNVGLGLTAAISVPFTGMAVVSKRGAGAFEKSMNNVNAALRGINTEQLDALSDAARRLGPDVGRSAKEAADGVETLALAGMSADVILGGGLQQTLRLAAANAADLGESAAVVTDVMAQFGKTSGDLEGVVNNITGALDASKLGFNDFKDAIAQGGGVAGAAGVSFEDFNTALAGTSALFGSGADAGTSFKTFITTLTPQSKEAAEMMKKLGLEFYDASGQMKSLADISEMLRQKLGNLSDRSRTKVLTEIFGADAMRTAIGLMRLGGQAFEDLQDSIAKTDAGEKLAIQLKGVEASAEDLGNAFDELKIALGETGILAAFTAFQTALASVTRWLAELPLPVRTVAVALWGVTAAVGPMILALMGISKVLVPILLLRGGLGAVGILLGTLINPVGALVALLGRLALGLSGVSVALRVVGLTMTAFAGWIGLAVTALVLLVLWINRTKTANAAAAASAAAASKAYANQQQLTLQLVGATGQLRKELLAKAQADRKAALDAMFKAKADVEAAKAALIRAKAEADGTRARRQQGKQNIEQAEADLLARAKALHGFAKTVDGLTNAIKTPEYGTVDLSFGDTGASSTKSGPSAKELADRRAQMALEQQMAVARARDDKDEIRVIQDKLDLLQRQRDYEDAGLTTSAAKLAAKKDIAEIKAAEADYNAREVEQAENALDLQLAEIRGDQEMARQAADKAYLEERTAFWQGKSLTLLQAQARAGEDLVQVDIARAEAAAKVAEAQALDRAAELSRLRSDSAAAQREAERAAELRSRTDKYYSDGNGKISEEDARDRATRELDQEDLARQQGQWRDTFKGAMRAALDGDLKDFAKNWWKDMASKGMEEALNSLSDMLFNLFRQALSQASSSTGGSGGGLFGSILSGVGSLFGGGNSLGGVSNASMASINSQYAALAVPGNLPGFATGGSFEIGGKPGIDTNLVQFWGTAGETVNVRRGGDDRDGGGDSYHFTGNLLTPEWWAMINANSQQNAAGAVNSSNRRRDRRAARRMGR